MSSLTLQIVTSTNMHQRQKNILCAVEGQLGYATGENAGSCDEGLFEVDIRPADTKRVTGTLPEACNTVVLLLGITVVKGGT